MVPHGGIAAHPGAVAVAAPQLVGRAPAAGPTWVELVTPGLGPYTREGLSAVYPWRYPLLYQGGVALAWRSRGAAGGTLLAAGATSDPEGA